MEKIPEKQLDENNQEDKLLYTYNRELFYGFDKDGKYVRKVHYQNPSNQVIIKQSWDAAEERIEEVKQKVLAGLISPVAFFMEKNLMEVPMLAAYMEMWKFTVRRHFKPKVFNKLKPEILQKYADVFGISVEELRKPNFNQYKYRPE